MGAKGSLARQLLGWQLVIVFALLGCVTVFSVIQSNESFQDVEGRRMLSVAENVAATPGVRENLENPFRRDPLPIFAESARSLSGADYVIIADPAHRVLTSPDPSQLGQPMPLDESTVTEGRSWVGVIDGSLVAHVPVIADTGNIIGLVAAGKATPGFFEAIANSPANALVLLAIATVLGLAGSVLLSWRVTRQTLGLEPNEITGLVEHREALLHGIKEGVIALDQQDRVTLVNDRASELLALPSDCVGVAVDALDVNERLRDVLTGRASGVDQIVLRAGRVLVINRLPISRHGRALGAVATLRDRTELVVLREELAANSRATDTLRAQAHEFTNRLHTIAGLIELGEYDEVRNYVDLVSRAHDDWHDQVSARIGDSAVAALLIAKASVAAEHDVGIRLTDDSHLTAVDEQLSADLVTVVGNLVDNALDALRDSDSGAGGDWIEVAVRHHPDEVSVVVRDSGPGVAPEIATEVFAHGFTTKAAEHGGQRGLGLALTRQTCKRRGGSVEVHSFTGGTERSGAEFTARLPIRADRAKVAT
ncbi:sensor histidine kinase [Amycolatopsis nigrescens]|uniref:sensor histidine kinase n=1 Tax=Amycolatopsis nigrescens TaxID=381445 RepID=UPI0003A44672|nr:sensor histidine kinase [Amycolatopsis nigrescens]